MKTLKRIPLLIFTIGLLALATKAVPPTQITWGIWFDTPTNMPVLSWWVPGTNQAYKLYGTSSPGMPVANYPLLAVWTNWLLFTNSAGSIFISNNITLAAKQQFLLVNPTNTWGELPFGDFGQTVQTGPPWSTVTSVQIGK